jgi:hypothetical protein
MKFANKHAFSRAQGWKASIQAFFLKKTKLKSPSNEQLYIRDRGQPKCPLNCSKQMRLDFAMVSAGQFQLAPFLVVEHPIYIFTIAYIQFRLQRSY